MTFIDWFLIGITVVCIPITIVGFYLGALEARGLRKESPESRNWLTAVLALTFLPWWPEE